MNQEKSQQGSNQYQQDLDRQLQGYQEGTVILAHRPEKLQTHAIFFNQNLKVDPGKIGGRGFDNGKKEHHQQKYQDDQNTSCNHNFIDPDLS